MWIKLHTDLPHHPKLLKLQTLTGWDTPTAIGKLTLFWCWVAHYAEDGDLRRHGLKAINILLGLPKDDKSLLKTHFVDKKPFLRIHDWWDYFGIYLRSKYQKDSEKWENIRKAYTNSSSNNSSNMSTTSSDKIDKEASLRSKRASKKNQDAREASASGLAPSGAPLASPALRETARVPEWEDPTRRMTHEEMKADIERALGKKIP